MTTLNDLIEERDLLVRSIDSINRTPDFEDFAARTREHLPAYEKRLVVVNERIAIAKERAALALEDARAALAASQDLPETSRARRVAELDYREAQIDFGGWEDR